MTRDMNVTMNRKFGAATKGRKEGRKAGRKEGRKAGILIPIPEKIERERGDDASFP